MRGGEEEKLNKNGITMHLIKTAACKNKKKGDEV